MRRMHFLMGVLMRRIVPLRTQNQIGKVMFWVIGIPLLVGIVGMFVAVAIWGLLNPA